MAMSPSMTCPNLHSVSDPSTFSTPHPACSFNHPPHSEGNVLPHAATALASAADRRMLASYKADVPHQHTPFHLSELPNTSLFTTTWTHSPSSSYEETRQSLQHGRVGFEIQEGPAISGAPACVDPSKTTNTQRALQPPSRSPYSSTPPRTSHISPHRHRP
ncbi:hypothetical protein BDZ89DRAFT_179177 [Hymenopellis radicata]|nr:hypothetical protein BDZ89DRAFT_179177 [Hymenopellis radicata]